MRFDEWITWQRESRGWTRSELAQRMNKVFAKHKAPTRITAASIHAYETRGIYPRAGRLAALARVFKIPLKRIPRPSAALTRTDARHQRAHRRA